MHVHDTRALATGQYVCTACGAIVARYKSSYWECHCARIGIYADVPLPETWQFKETPQEDEKCTAI